METGFDCVEEEGRVMMRGRDREGTAGREGSAEGLGKRKRAWEQERLVRREREGASKLESDGG